MAASVPPSSSAKLSFPPRTGFVALATDFVLAFCAGHTNDEEMMGRIQLTAHELVENLIKYCSGDVCIVEVSVMGGDDQPVVFRMTTENRVETGPLAQVSNYLTLLERAASPDQFYDECIARTARRTDGSGLGLARIRAEACMAITHQVIQDQLRVTAETPLPVARGRKAE